MFFFLFVSYFEQSLQGGWVTLIVMRASSANNLRQMVEWPHSFPFIHWIRPHRQDESEWLAWHSKATVAHGKPVWTGINYQSVYRRGGEITKAIRIVLTNKPPRSCQWMQTDRRLWLWHWPLLNFRLEFISKADWSRLCLFSPHTSVISAIIPWLNPTQAVMFLLKPICEALLFQLMIYLQK